MSMTPGRAVLVWWLAAVVAEGAKKRREWNKAGEGIRRGYGEDTERIYGSLFKENKKKKTMKKKMIIVSRNVVRSWHEKPVCLRVSRHHYSVIQYVLVKRDRVHA